MQEEIKSITDKEYARIINERINSDLPFNILIIPYEFRSRNTPGAKDGINEAQDISRRLHKPNKKNLLNMYIKNPEDDDSEDYSFRDKRNKGTKKTVKNYNNRQRNDHSENRQFRVLFLDEFIQLTEKLNNNNDQSPFKEDDTLYIAGHANLNTMVKFHPDELAEQLEECLKVTGIKNIKLLGCHTGSRVIEDLSQDDNIDEDLKESLTNSYAKKLSEELYKKDLRGIKVYGYMGALTNETEEINNNNSRSKRQKQTVHKMRSFVKPIKVDGSDDVENKVRASKARVCFIDGQSSGQEPELQNSHVGPLGNDDPKRYYGTGL